MKSKEEQHELKPKEKGVVDLLNRKVIAGETLRDILDFLFQSLKDCLPCDRLDLGFIEDDVRRIVFYHVAASYEPVLLNRDYVYDLTGGYTGRIFDTGEPVIVKNLPEELDELSGESAELLVDEGIRSCMIVPITIDGRPAGIFSCRSRKPGAFSRKNIPFIESVLSVIRLVVEKTYRIQQIEKTTEGYMEMLSVVSHEMKSPLASIITLGKTLSSGYFGKIEDKQKEIVDRIIKKAEYLHALSSEYLSLSRFESGELQINPKLVDLFLEVVDPTIELLRPQIDEKRVSLEKNYNESILPLNCDPDLVRIVLVNLLSNAVKYGNIDGVVRITVERRHRMVVVSVWNEGPGFPEIEKKRLFRKFSRLQTTELREKKGTGVGLYVSWKIVQLHGGVMRADSEHGSWALFTMELPMHGDMCILP